MVKTFALLSQLSPLSQLQINSAAVRRSIRRLAAANKALEPPHGISGGTISPSSSVKVAACLAGREHPLSLASNVRLPPQQQEVAARQPQRRPSNDACAGYSLSFSRCSQGGLSPPPRSPRRVLRSGPPAAESCRQYVRHPRLGSTVSSDGSKCNASVILTFGPVVNRDDG